MKNKNGKKRVVITGMATINPLGDTLDTYIDNLLMGKSGIVPWKSIDVSGIECKVGGDLGAYDCMGALEKLATHLEPAHYRKLRRLFKVMTFSAKTAVVCSLDAWRDAGLFGTSIDPYRIGAMVAGHNLNSNYLYANMLQFTKEPEFIDALSSVEGIDPAIPGLITEALQIYGPAMTIGGACASGNLALRDAVRDLQSDECDISVVAGALFDMSIADLHASEFISATVTNPKYQNHPEQASRPFDKNREGFIYSHGAGTLIVETLESARARNAKIYAEVIGVRANSNANHQPQPSADLQNRLIVDLLRTSGTKPEDVDYINCHATGTPLGRSRRDYGDEEDFWRSCLQNKIQCPKVDAGTCLLVIPYSRGHRRNITNAAKAASSHHQY